MAQTFFSPPDRARLRIILQTLVIGFSGAALATWAGMPAAPLVGASIAVSLAALGSQSVEIPAFLGNIAFTVIGCSLGSSITRQSLAQSVQWPISLIFLGLSVLLIMWVCSWYLYRFYRLSPETAVLSTAPGTISYVLAFAASGIGDIRSILVIQNIRLVLVTTLLPFILDHLGLRATPLAPAVTGTMLGSLAVLVPALAIGFSIRRWHIPASYLLVGMVCSGFAHYFDLVTGRPPSPLIFFGFAITGSLVGTRFSAIPLADLKRMLGASFGSVILAGLLAAACAYPSAVLLDIPFGQVFVAYAPGGVEAMAAMAIALGYDPAYVATHHLFRICLLFLFVPISIKIARRGAARRHE